MHQVPREGSQKIVIIEIGYDVSRTVYIYDDVM